MMGWQGHQLDIHVHIQIHMQITCTSLQTDKHASTATSQLFYGPDALPATQPTASKY